MAGEQYVALIQRYFPRDAWNTAYQIMMRESGGDPNAANDEVPARERSYGLFQINTNVHNLTPDQARDPETNVRYAAQLYRSQGWQPWVTNAELQQGIAAGSTAQGGATMPDTTPQDDPNRVVASTTYVKDNVSYIQETHADGTVTQRHWEGARGVGANQIAGISVGGEQVPPAGTGNWIDDGVIDTDQKIAAAWEKKQAAASKESSVSAPPSQKFIVSRDAQGNENWVPNPNYTPPSESGRPSRVAASPDEPNIIIMDPDGSLRSAPNPNYQPGRAKPGYQQYGRTVYRIDPETGDLRPYMDIPEDPRDPLSVEYDRLRNQGLGLQNEKLRQDLVPPIQKLLQDREAALTYIRGELIAGRMNSAQANQYMAQIDAQAQAALKGTTIFQQQEADRLMQRQQQQMGASMLNQRVQSGGSIMNGILQSLQGVMMPKGQTSLGFSPLQMVTEQLNAYGGGPEAYAFAKGLLMGAGVGQGGAPSGATPTAAPSPTQAPPQPMWNPGPRGGTPPPPQPQAQPWTPPPVAPQPPVGRPPVPRAI